MVEPHTSESSKVESSLPLEHLRKTLEELSAEGPEGLKRMLNERRPHLSEVTLLTEYVAQLPYQRPLNFLIQSFKRYVNQALPDWKQQLDQLDPTQRKQESERLEKLQKRFEDAVMRFEEARQSYEKQCKDNAEQARKLLAELKDIVVNEQLDAFPRVRKIAHEWKKLRQTLLPHDRKELSLPFQDFLKQFEALYERYRDIFEGERHALVQRRSQILEEIERLFPPEGTQTTFEFWQHQRDKLALLQSEWHSLPRLGSRKERELAQRYKELVTRFREQYSLFRSQAYQRVQRDPILQEAYRRKKQIIELLSPLVEKDFSSVEEWKQANKQVKEYIKEWRKLTERSIMQDDSREVRRFYAPLNQQFGELLDKFSEKSERFNKEYRLQQLRKLIENGKKFIQEVKGLLKRDLSEAVRRYRGQVALWRRRSHRFQKEAAVIELNQEI
ncbi:MAG: DUF349 domain-containing protein, partial [Bacteroidia bacterium]|nr:DUF349 domain-containing protein [Bacteroidia bacterium]